MSHCAGIPEKAVDGSASPSKVKPETEVTVVDTPLPEQPLLVVSSSRRRTRDDMFLIGTDRGCQTAMPPSPSGSPSRRPRCSSEASSRASPRPSSSRSVNGSTHRLTTLECRVPSTSHYMIGSPGSLDSRLLALRRGSTPWGPCARSGSSATSGAEVSGLHAA